jgi:acetyl esterase
MPSGPVAADLQAIVERLAAIPPPHTLTVSEARAASRARRALLDRPRERVRVVHDFTIPYARGPMAARLYSPTEANAPTLLYLHGGGWVLGDLEGADPFCRSFANAAACTVVSLDYPLAPEHRFPEPVEAALAAASWLATEGKALGLDTKRLAVGGDSAGANLAAALALMARDRGGPSLAYQLLIVPVLDAALATASSRDHADGPLLTRADMEWFWGHYLARADDGDDPYASPLRADARGLPPALVVTAEFDLLRDEGTAYAAKLREAGVPVRHRDYRGMVHGFLGFAGELPAAERAIAEIAREVRDALAAQGSGARG